ncbi:TspO/MBR family protein [Gordonia sp. CPCC 205515]|uniref:TspO/MBR family protein n=1 Tax=Gordonia sp. CPCC 205515 TaxID=3140791 RepID=UPI003AF340AE
MRPTTLIATGLATAAASVAGTVTTRSSLETWYPRLRKPGFTPPTPVIPIVWTTLYADIAVTSAVAIDDLREQGRDDEAAAYAAALAANLVLNAGWSWLFFGAHRLGAAAVTAGALAVSSADLTRRTAQANAPAGAALAPYPLWCAFATALSTEFWRLNRGSRLVR